MKTLKSIFFSLLFISIATIGFAQTKSETIKVAGECGMCKTKIEKAAKGAGATYAVWDSESKQLSVKYNSTTSNAAKIQQSIAATGYDTQDYKATDASYNSLHECCKYERTAATEAKAKCCNSDQCDKGGNCSADAACCKDKACCSEGADCCKGGKCTKEGHAQTAANHNAKAGSCCKKS
jgi:hypothetical protein